MNPRSGGAERSTFEICKELVRRGWEVRLLAGGFPGARHEEWLGGVKVIRGAGPVALHLELPEILRNGAPADVIVEDLGHVVPFAAERFVRSPGVVFFRHLHRRTLSGQVGIPAQMLLSAIERAYPLIYRRWPLVAPSNSAMGDLISLGFDPSRVHKIGYGVDLSTFKPGKPSDTPSLVYFSGLRRYKRPHHALYALRMLRTEGVNATLSVIGVGPELTSLRRLSRDLGIDDFVRFTGRLEDTELAALVARSWVHLQCSVAEGWGLTAWEAAASGVPTVAYNVPGLADSVMPGVSGSLVEDGHILELARAVAAIIRNRPIWTDRCRQSVIGHSWQTVGQEWEALLGQSLDM
jgi:glycosyltransferase involved in cell wall biosynthesis